MLFFYFIVLFSAFLTICYTKNCLFDNSVRLISQESYRAAKTSVFSSPPPQHTQHLYPQTTFIHSFIHSFIHHSFCSTCSTSIILLRLHLHLAFLPLIHIIRSIIELILALPMRIDPIPFPSHPSPSLLSSPASGPRSSSSPTLFSALYTRGISLICTDGQPSICLKCSHTC